MPRLLFSLFLVSAISLFAEPPIPEIPRRIPPKGIDVSDEKKRPLVESLLAAQLIYDELDHPEKADAGVLLKGVEFALLNGEFYHEKDLKTAERHLALAKERLDSLKTATSPDWGRGHLVRGYESQIDGSLQPYGLEIPNDLDFSKPVPLLVWLHGRGDKTTDLHFIERCLTRSQHLGGKNAAQQQCIVLHPFGRQCIGWKHAGEIDVHDAIAEVQRLYSIDPSKIILAGFSMGGAGAWHVGAHYADRFSIVHAGAGFAETARYNRLTPDKYPVWYEQTLWGVYDVPNYTRNLLNLPLVAYSGEEDKQKQAADLMAEALAEHGYELDHRIGPGMGHKYHDDLVGPIFEALLAAKINPSPSEIHFQTQTLRYNRYHWLTVTKLAEHWQDSRVDARETDAGFEIHTQNITGIQIKRTIPEGTQLEIDGQEIRVPSVMQNLHLVRQDSTWAITKIEPSGKRPGIQGPIDDAFMSPFLVVIPDRKSENPRFQRWLDFEIVHFVKRWRELFRGNLRLKNAGEVTSDDVQNFNLICFGEPGTNAVIGSTIDQLPIDWSDAILTMNGQNHDAATHIPTLISPNPLNNSRYIVLNSGLTFREGHDKTNSLQNPKLPDWAVIDLSQDPNELSSGKIANAGFFDESWNWKKK